MVIKNSPTNIISFKQENQLVETQSTKDIIQNSLQIFISNLFRDFNIPSNNERISRKNSKEIPANNNQEEIPKLFMHSFIT